MVGVIFDSFVLANKYYKLLDDQDDMHFRAIAESRLPQVEVCRKYKGEACLAYSAEDILEAFRNYLAPKYPGHKDDIDVEMKVFPVFTSE